MDLVKSQLLEELNIKALTELDSNSDVYLQAQASVGDQTEIIVQLETHTVALEGGYMVAVDSRN